jgi:hypothetical protein
VFPDRGVLKLRVAHARAFVSVACASG